MTTGAALRLGRVSNLPTVWTNVLAGLVLAGAGIGDARLIPLLVAFSLFYLAGMFLNDYFDRGFDAAHRPERPLPAGEADASSVLRVATAMLIVGLALMAWVGFGFGGETGPRPLLVGILLVGAILLYDRFHKGNPLSPAIMAACRALVYLGAGVAAIARPDAVLYLGGAVLFAYLVGLTYVAKQETLGEIRNLWPLAFLVLAVGGAVALAVPGGPGAIVLLALFLACVLGGLGLVARRRAGDIPRAVVTFIAGISLLDAALIAGAGALGAGLLAATGFVATLLLQRVASGT